MTWVAGDRAILRQHAALGPVDPMYAHYEGQEVLLVEDMGVVKTVMGKARRWHVRFIDPTVKTLDDYSWALEPSLQPLPPGPRGTDPKAQRILEVLEMLKAGKIAPGWHP